MRIASPTLAALLLILGGTSTAQAGPCKKSPRLKFHADMGEAKLTKIFTSLESVSQRNHKQRRAIRASKCKLLKMSGAKDWKAASKALPALAAAKPEVRAEVLKLRNRIPKNKKRLALVEEAKLAKRQYDAMIEVRLPDKRTQQYLQNIEHLRGWVTDLTKANKHMAGMRARMTGVLKKAPKKTQEP